MAAPHRAAAPARPSRLRDSQQPRPSQGLTPEPQCVFERPAPLGGRQKGYIYLLKEAAAAAAAGGADPGVVGGGENVLNSLKINLLIWQIIRILYTELKTYCYENTAA